MSATEDDGAQAVRDRLSDDALEDPTPPKRGGKGRKGQAPALISDDELASRFTARHGAGFRHVAAWGHWFAWTGQVWRREDTLQVFDLARAICREASRETAKRADRPKIASAQRVSAVERLARADRQHAATVDQWDADPWSLNTPAGIVDLRTGRAARHRPDAYLTKITAVAPERVPTPNWSRFLDRVTGGDKALQGFLARVVGYGLTGETREHALFFFYGTGGNGKGVFLNTVAGVLGDYASVAPMETFTATSTDRHPTDLAMLRGARLVTAQETEEGRRWAESKIKALTGGDPITARFMRQDFFTFVPQFKLLIAGNHKPGLRNVDEAVRRRFHLIPFTISIPTEEQDPELPAKLRAEWPGILAWAIDGCRTWQAEGLAPPKAVSEATREYLEAEDSFAAWMEDELEPHDGCFETSATLFGSWRAWAERAGERAGSQKRFAQMMAARGAVKGKDAAQMKRGFWGFRLRHSGPDDAEPPVSRDPMEGIDPEGYWGGGQ